MIQESLPGFLEAFELVQSLLTRKSTEKASLLQFGLLAIDSDFSLEVILLVLFLVP